MEGIQKQGKRIIILRRMQLGLRFDAEVIFRREQGPSGTGGDARATLMQLPNHAVTEL